MRFTRSLAMLSFAIIVFCGATFADTINFGGPGGDLGSNTHTFTSGSSSITVTDYTKTDLYSKNATGDENGLGLANGGSDHEIGGSTNFVQFLSAGITSITIGSVQTGETWVLFGSSIKGTEGTTPITSFTTTNTAKGVVVTFTGALPTYISLAAKSGDVLLNSANISAVPESGTPAMILTLGLVCVFAFGRSKLGRLAA